MSLFAKTGHNQNRVIPREEYHRVFMHIGYILRPGLEHEELNQLVKKDFDDDCMDKDEHGKEVHHAEDDGQHNRYGMSESIDEKKLYDAIFELVDTWVPNINEMEYKNFLEVLTFKLKYSNQQDTQAYDVLP